MKKRPKAATPIRIDTSDRRREACFEAIEQIKTALKVVERLGCDIDAKAVSILQLSAAALSEIGERR